MMASDEDVARERRPELLSFWIDYFAEWIVAARGCELEEAVVHSTLLMAVLSGLVIDLHSTGDLARIQRSLEAYLAAWHTTGATRAGVS
jgi:hypothetical protein